MACPHIGPALFIPISPSWAWWCVIPSDWTVGGAPDLWWAIAGLHRGPQVARAASRRFGGPCTV